MKQAIKPHYHPNYTTSSLLKDGRRSYLWGKYDIPFQFNIVVNHMRDVQNYKPTKYQFIGEEIRDLSAIVSSSASDRMVKVG